MNKRISLTIDEKTWKSFKKHCIKNKIFASIMVNDWMASVTGNKPKDLEYVIKVKKS